MPQSPHKKPPRKPSPLSPQEVAKAVREALGSDGRIFTTRHFRERGQQRNFGMRDALTALEKGTVAPVPHWNERTGTWNYDVHGSDVEGDPLTVRIAVEGASSIVLVTAFG